MDFAEVRGVFFNHKEGKRGKKGPISNRRLPPPSPHQVPPILLPKPRHLMKILKSPQRVFHWMNPADGPKTPDLLSLCVFKYQAREESQDKYQHQPYDFLFLFISKGSVRLFYRGCCSSRHRSTYVCVWVHTHHRFMYVWGGIHISC